jgi:DNA end-binding protein Ku
MASTIWRGYVTFALISIPVRLHRAARAEKVTFRRLHREEPLQNPERISRTEMASPAGHPLRTSGSGDSGQRSESRLKLVSGRTPSDGEPDGSNAPVLTPVRQASIRKESDEIVPAEAVVKGYEYEKNRFVEIDPEELKSAAAQTSSEIAIQEFVKLADIDPVYFETSYYISPESAGEKAYALLYRSMQETGLVAIAQFAMHNREHIVVLRPGKKGMLAHTMFYRTEVRSSNEHPADTHAVTDKELSLARTLVDSLAGPFEPEKYRDTYRERLEALVAAKVQGDAASPAEGPKGNGRVVDLAEALRKSLANLKKPAGSEREVRKQLEAAPAKTKRAPRAAGNRG